jgi:hypothetical protein
LHRTKSFQQTINRFAFVMKKENHIFIFHCSKKKRVTLIIITDSCMQVNYFNENKKEFDLFNLQCGIEKSQSYSIIIGNDLCKQLTSNTCSAS